MYEHDSIDLCATAYATKRTVESRILRSYSGRLPRKKGKKVRGVSETASFALRIISIGTQQEKNDYFNWFAHQACAYTYLANFRLKKALARMVSTSLVRATDFQASTHLTQSQTSH